MKKILLATSILAGTAGFAAAEVAVTGTARMGIVASGGDAAFSSRVRIIFTATGETDGGLSFGASVRNDQDGGNGNDAGGTESGFNNTDSTVYISGAFGKLTMGDTGNAVDTLLGQVSGVGYTSLNSMNELQFLPKIGTGALYEYSAGSITFGVGSGQTSVGVDFLSAAVKYSTDAFTVGLGYENLDVGGSVSQMTLTGSATFSGATVKAKIVDGDNTTDTQYALSVDYAVNGIGLTAYYADHQDAVVGLQGEAYGIGASYDLGGGAVVKGGIARNEGSDAVMDLGLNFTF